jgi:hypothetical protein
MKRTTLLLIGALLATMSVACQQHEKQYVPSDPAARGMIPKEAHVVAESSNASSPLLFVPDEDGTVYFFANDDLLATIGVARGQKVELNELQGGQAETVLTINGKVSFKVGTRASHHRLFFVPAAKPVMTRAARDVLH